MASVSQLGYLADRKGRKTNPFPAKILGAAFALLAFAVGAIIFGQTTGIGTVKNQMGMPVAVRDIVLSRGAGDSVLVHDAGTGAMIASYPADQGGFVRGSLRAFERMRMVSQIPTDTPYRLIKWQAGMVSLSDTATGERIYLDPFGKDNAGAFEALLERHGGGAKQ